MRRLETARTFLSLLEAHTQVETVTLYGSLANDNADALSDIDICLCISDAEPGAVMLSMPNFLAKFFPVVWSDIAPSLLPAQCVISIAIDPDDPFLIVDCNCMNPHRETTLRREQISLDPLVHTMKLWAANAKHVLRGVDCRRDIEKMARRCGIMPNGRKDGELLTDILVWMETQPMTNLQQRYIAACRSAWTLFR